MRTARHLRHAGIISLILALVLAACSSDDGAGSGRLKIVATTTILGDIVGNVAGDRATVEVMMPIGADPHDYQASSQQVAAINEADLVVANGLLLEEGLLDVLEGAEADGANVLEVGPGIDPLPFGDEPCDPKGHDEGEDRHGSCDPHSWMDPIRVAQAARLIAAELNELDPAIDWTANAEDYADRLGQVDDEIQTMLAVIPEEERRLVTNHESLGYFAERYGFTVVGVVLPGGSTLGEPSSQELANLVEVIRAEGVRAIFAETTQPSVLADAVAAEVGEDIAVVELFTGSLGAAGSGAETLEDLLITDASLIADALS